MAYIYIYIYVKKINTGDPNTASEFPRDNIPEGDMGAFNTSYNILFILLSGHFYVHIWIRKKQLISS